MKDFSNFQQSLLRELMCPTCQMNEALQARIASLQQFFEGRCSKLKEQFEEDLAFQKNEVVAIYESKLNSM